MSPWWTPPGLLETGHVNDRVMAVRDGIMNFYVLKGPAGLICIDAGWRRRGIERGFRQLGLEISQVTAIFLTHWHWDHARGCRFFHGAHLYGGRGTLLTDGQKITKAGMIIQAISTPGHTSDSVCYLVDGCFLFTGDALRLRDGKVVSFPRIFNRDRSAAMRSIQKLAGVRGVESMFTAHFGMTDRVGEAFI